MDYTYTAPGSYAFMDILRTPLSGNTEKNLETINEFKNDRNLRNATERILRECGPEMTGDYTAAIEGPRSFSPYLVFLMFPLAAAILITLILLLFTGKGEFFIYGTVPSLLAATMLQSAADRSLSIKKRITSEGIDFEIGSLVVLGKIIKAAGKLTKLNSPVYSELKESLEKIKGADRNFNLLLLLSSNQVFYAVSSYILIKHIVYYFTVRNLKTDSREILEVTKNLGRTDALLSFARVTEELKTEDVPLCDAKRSGKEKFLSVKNLVHPLVKDCVGNSVVLSGKPSVITGSNMSGKSTFLKALALSAVTAETFGVAFCDEYIGSPFNIMTSMSPEEDISGKKSYFLSEAEAVKRLIDALNPEKAGLYVIDEIFRGTNPEERIAASAKIIDYLGDSNCLLLVSTHDIEMIRELKGETDQYHFGGTVRDNQLYFPYTIEEGISSGTNALRVLEIIGYPTEITDEARILAEDIKIRDKTVVSDVLICPDTTGLS